ncbi:MAG: mannose-1-phosphate guanylyltransferase [Patescibacteria group bacterium]
MKVSIFCGGSGKRFWPLSRKNKPKQLLPLFDGKSTLQLTYERISPLLSPEDIFISTSKDYFAVIKKQLPELCAENLIGEPALRDLGPAVCLNTAILSRAGDKEEPFAILWSDHVLEEEQIFRDMVSKAEELVESGEAEIVFFGCSPRYANENLGWIGFREPLSVNKPISIHDLASFQYRPDKETAENYFESGKYAWNLGYFVSTPRFILDAFKKHCPGIYKGVKKIAGTWGEESFGQILGEVYPSLQKISFDDAVLEKLDYDKAKVLVADLGWADVGNPYAYKETLVGKENLFVGDTVDIDSSDTVVYNDTDKLVATAGLEGLVVIVTEDAILVCGKDDAKKVKKLVQRLEDEGRTSLL